MLSDLFYEFEESYRDEIEARIRDAEAWQQRLACGGSTAIRSPQLSRLLRGENCVNGRTQKWERHSA
jgi:hypothetical protein